MRIAQAPALLVVAALTSCATAISSADHGHGRDDCEFRAVGREVRCGETLLATVECYSRRGGSCHGALAVRYADGDVAWLYRSPRFDPERQRLRPLQLLEQPKVHLADNVEMTTDGRLLWYETIDEDSRGWHVFDTTTGKVRRAGEGQIAQLRDQYAGGFIGVPLVDPRPR